ncbi:MAG: hypothetical protein ABFQ62_00440 [Patescibacteria group bacterium]
MAKPELKKLSILFLVWRTSLFIIGFLAQKALPYDPSFPYSEIILAKSNLPIWLYSWANFDGVHYLTIVREGYFGTGLIQAFFPLFPILVKLISLLVTSKVLAGLIISNLFLFLFFYIWFIFAKEEWGKKIAHLSLFTIMLFPTSFFMGSLYTESLFLFLITSSFFSAKRKNWALAGVFAALASATRVVGILLVPSLLIELLNQNYQKRIIPSLVNILKTKKKEMLWIFSGSLGLVIYMLYLNYKFYDPLYFFHVQSEFGGGRQESLILYPQVVFRYIKILLTYRPINLSYYAYVQEFLISTLGLIALIFSYKYVRKSFLFFALAAFFVPTLTGTFSSMPRYILVSFPIFIYLAKLLEKKTKLKILYFSISTLLLIFNTILFIQGYWVA